MKQVHLTTRPNRFGAMYRCLDADGQLLYVGSTSSPSRRHARHRAGTESAVWWKDVVSVEWTFFQTLGEALNAEMDAIESESPLHNKMLARGE